MHTTPLHLCNFSQHQDRKALWNIFKSCHWCQIIALWLLNLFILNVFVCLFIYDKLNCIKLEYNKVQGFFKLIISLFICQNIYGDLIWSIHHIRLKPSSFDFIQEHMQECDQTQCMQCVRTTMHAEKQTFQNDITYNLPYSHWTLILFGLISSYL